MKTPYDRVLWYCTRDRQRLLKLDQENKDAILYLPSETSARATRRGVNYVASTEQAELDDTYVQFASVAEAATNTVSIHSSKDLPLFGTEDRPHSLLDSIRLLPNQSLWRDLDLDGDGDWLIEGI